MTAAVRAKAFEADLLPWLAVSHLLNAPLMRELGQALVKVGSAGRIAWGMLFEDQVSPGPRYLANLALRHLPARDPTARFLKRAVWALVALSDDPPSAFGDQFEAGDQRTLHAISYAFEVARADFSGLDLLRPQLGEPPEPLQPLLAALDLVRTWGNAPLQNGPHELRRLLPANPALRAALTKHLGDLCQDADRPAAALVLYRQADAILEEMKPAAWTEFATDLRWVVRQSEAAALRDHQGPRAAAVRLLPPLQSEALKTAPILRVNGVQDAFYAEILGADTFSVSELESTQVLYAPQLITSYDLGAALAAWRKSQWPDTGRLFWATLRRQIALGCASEARHTRALFGRCILEGLADALRRERRPEDFKLAIQLLLQSGEPAAVSQAKWSQPLLEVYLTDEIVEHALACVSAHSGSAQERRLTLIPLLREWLLQLPVALKSLAPKLLEVLAAIARDEPFLMLQGRTHAQESLKALAQVAEERPELAKLASTAVANAVIAKLAGGAFRPAWAALDTAYAFAGAFTPDDLSRCIRVVLSFLTTVEPGDAGWPVIRPALGLISEEHAQALWRDDPVLARRSAETVLRFGLGSKSENVRLMFLLKDVSPYLDLGGAEAEQLKEVVMDLRRRAHEINSSAVTGCISALLAAPVVSGIEGVEDAVAVLVEVLESVNGTHRSIGLAVAYQPLLQLAQGYQRLQQDLALDAPRLRALLQPLLGALVGVWRAAAEDPLVFTSFSIPAATAPNRVIVHNWTFATIAFAESMGALEQIEPFLAAAAVNPELAVAMAVARAVRLPTDARATLAPEAIESEREEAFYAALGQRLILLRAEEESAQARLLQILLQRCLRLGPSGLDAAVFTLAAGRGIAVATPDEAALYRQRLSTREDIKFSLNSLLAALEPERR